VTGASRGLGKAIAQGLADSGADVIVCARQRTALEDVAREIRQRGRKAWILVVDFSRADETANFFNAVLKTTASVDILVNAAGTTFRHQAVSFPPEEWQRVIHLNLTVPFLLSQHFAQACIENNRPGKIINLTSLLSEAARPTIPAYAASKGGLSALTKALAVEWAPSKIYVNAIGPGYVETELTQPLVKDDQFSQWVRERTPMNRWGAPDDLVGAAVFLASAASDFITGQTIFVDGGWLASL
jgi:gluconate 5-dehydrogenase